MKYLWGIFLAVLPVGGFAATNSFLAPASFPGTFADLEFTQQMAVKAAGYEAWESEYKNGRCVKNCAYVGITIADDDRLVQERTNAALGDLRRHGYTPTTSGILPTMIMPTLGTGGAAPQCTPHHPQILAGQTIPVGEPLIGQPRITTPYGERIHPVTGQPQLHKAVDLSAPVGTDVFAPASGTVAAAWTDASCGMGLRITHSHGYETIYCHLSDNTLVKPGQTVTAGCRVAKTGNTGRSTGPHLHYGIKKDGDFIDPTRFLNRG